MQNKNPRSLFGIDINEYTKNVNFNILASKIDFLYVRASGSATGSFRVDKKFINYAQESKKYGIPVGAYHFGVPSYDLTDADRQCDDFIDTLQKGFGSKNYGNLFPVLDVETPIDKLISVSVLLNWIQRFTKRFEAKTRRKLMLYTGLFFIQLYNNFYIEGQGYPLKNMILWIAMYQNIPQNPPIPPDIGGWTKWRMWQFTDSKIVEGTGNPVDANWGPNSIDLLVQPDAVSGLSSYKQNGNIYVSWNKNKDIDLLGYNIFINGEYIATVDEKTTKYVISYSTASKYANKKIIISMEAFDYDGEASQTRTKITL
ncbi:glycoside hydrolase family 25 protein [Clostridium sp. BJN0001]|uniref:glycoside hydrolase family 25 protein n=1 Tax=Clostridium sp. BJN0001 TaxID=2930219 RepID=UPI001FD5F7F1|nr:glycoside hydrolase family 25 protein [Clostridium sp. BJN0001]